MMKEHDLAPGRTYLARPVRVTRVHSLLPGHSRPAALVVDGGVTSRVQHGGGRRGDDDAADARGVRLGRVQDARRPLDGRVQEVLDRVHDIEVVRRRRVHHVVEGRGLEDLYVGVPVLVSLWRMRLAQQAYSVKRIRLSDVLHHGVCDVLPVLGLDALDDLRPLGRGPRRGDNLESS